MTDKLLKIQAVCEMTGLSPSTVSQRVADGRFPPGVKVGARSTRWSEREVAEWIAERLAERDAAPDVA